jgi:hypothetical protein
MANPLYGQNKADASLNASNQLKVLHFQLTAVATGETGELTENLNTGVDIPAGFMPLWSTVENQGSVDLASGAKTCDAGGTDLSGSLASLAAGAKVHTKLTIAPAAAAVDILVDGATLVASGSTIIDWKIYGYDIPNVSATNLEKV